MSVLSRVAAPAATHQLAGMVVDLLSDPHRAAPRKLLEAVGNQASGNGDRRAASLASRLVTWAGQVGIYPGQLGRVRAVNFGRLMMLTHPATDDPDRLLAASKCVLAEWATDDHFLDEESLGADAKVIAARLRIAADRV